MFADTKAFSGFAVDDVRRPGVLRRHPGTEGEMKRAPQARSRDLGGGEAAGYSTLRAYGASWPPGS